jgi:hypothetical protein
VGTTATIRRNSSEVNEFQLIKVVEDLGQRGIVDYTLWPGNNCIWVSYGLVDSYYIFDQYTNIIDIQFD